MIGIGLPLIDVLVTPRCFLKCPICYTPSGFGIEEADTYEMLKLVDNLAELGVPIINLSGGEPLMREDLPVIVEHTSKNGTGVYLATTGYGLIGEKYESMKDYISWLGLSLDGSSPDVSRLLKGYPKQAELITSIMGHFTENPPIHKTRIGTVVTSKNFHDVENIGKILTGNNGYVPEIWKLYQFCERGPRQVNPEEFELDDETFFSVANGIKNNFNEKIEVDINPRKRMNNSYLIVLPDLSLVVPEGKRYMNVGSFRGKNHNYMKEHIYKLSKDGILDLEKAPSNRAMDLQ